jgi:hypothetical protein
VSRKWRIFFLSLLSVFIIPFAMRTTIRAWVDRKAVAIAHRNLEGTPFKLESLRMDISLWHLIRGDTQRLTVVLSSPWVWLHLQGDVQRHGFDGTFRGALSLSEDKGKHWNQELPLKVNGAFLSRPPFVETLSLTGEASSWSPVHSIHMKKLLIDVQFDGASQAATWSARVESFSGIQAEFETEGSGVALAGHFIAEKSLELNLTAEKVQGKRAELTALVHRPRLNIAGLHDVSVSWSSADGELLRGDDFYTLPLSQFAVRAGTSLSENLSTEKASVDISIMGKNFSTLTLDFHPAIGPGSFGGATVSAQAATKGYPVKKLHQWLASFADTIVPIRVHGGTIDISARTGAVPLGAIKRLTDSIIGDINLRDMDIGHEATKTRATTSMRAKLLSPTALDIHTEPVQIRFRRLPITIDSYG